MKKKKRAKRTGVGARVSLSPEHESLVSELIRDAGNRTPDEVVESVPDARCAQGLVERLPSDESMIPLLSSLKERFPDKPVIRAIKRALFKLNKKGVSTEGFFPETDDAAGILKPVPKDPPLCYVGPISGTGTRAVMVILHTGGLGRETGFGIVSDTDALQEFYSQMIPKKGAMAMVEQFSEDSGPFVETSLAHVATILETAYQQGLKTRAQAPAGYLDMRPRLLERTSLLERPAIYDLMPETAVSETPASDTRLIELFEHPMFESWLIGADLLRPLVEDMYKVDESPLVLTDVQKSDRIQGMEDKFKRDIFTGEQCGRLKHRLEEMAYIFFKLGEQETAGRALAAARVAGEEITALKSNLIVDIIFERSLKFYRQIKRQGGFAGEPAKQNASPIIHP